MASSLLLDLPLEIRRIIYSYCFIPPYEKGSAIFVTPALATVREAEGNFVVPRGTSGVATRKCQHRDSHLSVIQINQQIRQEAYQLFAASHTLNFSDPLDFANGYLSHMPSLCLQSIKSLNLTWQLHQSCSKSLSSCRSGQKVVDIKSQLYKIMQLLESYPELLVSVDRFGFTLPFFCDYKHTYCTDIQLQMRTDLMRLSVMLCEKIDELLQRNQPALEEQYFLIEIAWPDAWYITLWRVSKQTFDQINDQDVLQKENCLTCQAAIPRGETMFRDHHEHDGIFANVDEILQAVKDGKRWDPLSSRQYELSVHKKWKAIFHPLGPRRSWNTNMKYLEAQRESSLSTRSRKRRRPIPNTDSQPES